MLAAFPWCGATLLLLALAGCGNKPDGTPYGINPAKHPDGHLQTNSKPTNSYGTGTGMPKGAEMNAVTSGTRAGLPMQQAPDMAPQ